MPEEKRSALCIRRERLLAFRSVDGIEPTGSKGTQEEVTILKTVDSRNGMAENLATVGTIGKPRLN
jgi:hypothetical protein